MSQVVPDVWSRRSCVAGGFHKLKNCAGLERTKDDRVLFWATKVLVRFLALREAAQKFLILFGNESGFFAMNHIKNSLRCRLTDKRLDELLRVAISPFAAGSSQRIYNITLLINLFVSVRWTACRSPSTNDWQGTV